MSSVPKDHPFASLSGTDNLVVFTTKRYNDRPLVVRGPGAGAEVTAAGIFSDVIQVCLAEASHPWALVNVILYCVVITLYCVLITLSCA